MGKERRVKNGFRVGAMVFSVLGGKYGDVWKKEEICGFCYVKKKNLCVDTNTNTNKDRSEHDNAG